MRNFVFALAFASLGCQGKSSAPAPAPVPHPIAAPPLVAANQPLACDEDLYQRWLAYKKESAAVLSTGLQTTAKHVEANKNTPQAGFAGMAGLAATGKELEIVQQRHGFTSRSAGQVENLAGAVANARSLDNPMLKGTVEMMRKMQKEGGPMKEGADKFFHDEEEKQKKEEAKARAKYGDQCVDVFIKHVDEINAVQMASARAVLGTPAPKK